MRARLIFNPNATTTDHGVRDALAGLLSQEVDLRVHATRARDHATELAAQAVEDGVDAVFALGGDGTANEVLNALAGTDVALGLLPGGGTNVLARALGLPRAPDEAARAQLAALEDGLDHRLGLGRLNGRYFGFQAGMGLDAAIVRRVEAAPGVKRRLGQLAFILQGLREWAVSTDRRDPACAVVGVEGAGPPGRMLVGAGNVDPYTYLGPRPLRLMPGASPDAALELLTIGPMSTARVLRAIVRAFRDGSHDRDPEITLVHDVGYARVTATRPVDLMVDGEYIGSAAEATFSHHPAMLRVLTPRASAARTVLEPPRPRSA